MKTKLAWFRRAPITVRSMTVTSILTVLALISAQFLTLSGFSNPFLILTLFLISQTILSGVTSQVEKGTIADYRRTLIGAVLQAAAACLIVADAVGMSVSEYRNLSSASEVDMMATISPGTGFALFFWSMVVVALLGWSVISVEHALPYLRGHRKNAGSKHLRKQRKGFSLSALRGKRAAKKHQAHLLLDLEHFFKGSGDSEK